MKPKIDFQSLLDVAYDLEREDVSWMQALVAQVEPSLPCAALGFARLDTELQMDLSWSAHDAMAEQLASRWAPSTNHYLRSRAPIVSLNAALAEHGGAMPPEDVELMGALLSRSPGREFWVCVNAGPDGRAAGLVVTARAGAFSAEGFAGWDRVLTHLGAAHRLRRSLAHADTPEAVLSPGSGRVEHLAGRARLPGAREALQAAARALERQRTRREGDPLEILLARRVLVAGRWSLVDRFEADGRRFTLAFVNDPLPAGRLFPELSAREEQIALFVALGRSLKLIAYELGLSIGGVGHALSRALTKLRLQGRGALIRMVHGRVEAAIGAGVPK